MKMRKDQQIRAAYKLLAPPPERSKECQEEIESALNHIKLKTKLGEYNLGISSKEKVAVKKLISALRRAQATYVSLSEFDHVPDIKTDFSEQIDECEKWLAHQTAGPKHRTSLKQQYAAREALGLILKFVPQQLDPRTHKIKFQRRATATRGGLWCNLAAVLYGEDIDMAYQVRRVQKDLRKIERTFRHFVTSLGQRDSTSD